MKKLKEFLKALRNKKDFLLSVKIRHQSKRLYNNRLKIDKTSRIHNSAIIFEGTNNIVTVKGGCHLNGMRILVVGNGNEIEIGNNVNINAGKVHPTIISVVDGTTIRIGDGSLLSNDVEIHTSDYHGIYTYDGRRINHEKDILIGKRVWIGMGAKILKGTEIADGCIVGAGSILSRKYSAPDTILAGVPAIPIKNNVIWTHPRYSELPSDSCRQNPTT